MRADPVPPFHEQAEVKRGNGRTLPNRFLAEVILIETAHVPTGLFQNERTCSVIPELLSPMQIEVESTGGSVTPLKRAGAEIALGRKRPARTDALRQFMIKPL